MDFFPTSTNLLLLRLYLVSGEFIHATTNIIVKAVNAITNAFEDRRYYFLEGYSTPFAEQAVNVYASTSAEVRLYYNADKRQFSKGSGKVNALPILSLEITRDNVVCHDLTDFIEKMTIISDGVFPSVSQIIHAWMIDSHIIVSRACDFQVRVVSEEGDTYTVNILNDEDISQVVKGEADAEEVEADELEALAEIESVAEAAAEPPKIE